MNNIGSLLEDVSSALIAGDMNRAVVLLYEAERQAMRRPHLLNESLKSGIIRLSGLAHAAAEGIADAQAIIDGAGIGARSIKSYDSMGNENSIMASKRRSYRF